MDLFEGKEPLDLSVPDAELRLFRDVDLGFDDQDLIEHLIAKTNWQAQAIKLWGNRMMSRLISSLAGQRFYDVSCGMRCYSRAAALQLHLLGHFTDNPLHFLH